MLGVRGRSLDPVAALVFASRQRGLDLRRPGAGRRGVLALDRSLDRAHRLAVARLASTRVFRVLGLRLVVMPADGAAG